MAVSIYKLRGISNELKNKLKKQGFNNSDQLLETARVPAKRRSLAESIGVETSVILELANRADLARVHGIGGVFSDLLEHAGVDTVKELATRRPDNLYAKLVEINQQSALAGRLPTPKVVKAWVTQAKELPEVMEY
jgi:predicted flap endonuclease-1-like 5' DNA nuclease